MKKFVTYFFQGLLYTAPLAITVYVVIIGVQFMDHLIPFDIPGLGIAVLLAGVTLIGYLTSSYIVESLFDALERLLNRTPLIKLIYSSIRDLLSAFVGKEKRFDQPVLVRISADAELMKLGFITQKDLSRLGIDENLVAVYLPHSYAFSGNLFIVSADRVKPLDANPAEVMKFIVSGGVSLGSENAHPGNEKNAELPSDTSKPKNA
ncbi:MAG: DUF502 domain-containing protein [Flavobacteriales bacterium]|nr:DUF502 domain-containing protein [Flavobacteriales bacterium]MCB9446790.1 DUF502 domain-containing protein [Flavobacteriales bacterium]